jgi:hypothetical protein
VMSNHWLTIAGRQAEAIPMAPSRSLNSCD